MPVPGFDYPVARSKRTLRAKTTSVLRTTSHRAVRGQAPLLLAAEPPSPYSNAGTTTTNDSEMAAEWSYYSYRFLHRRQRVSPVATGSSAGQI
jgi:hypothetical protein